MSTITKGRLLRDDFHWYDGRSYTASRKDRTGGTITGLRVGDMVDVLQVYGGGTARTRGTLESAIRAIGTDTEVTLAIAPGEWAIDDDLTIPENISVFVPAGAVFDVAYNQVLTIAGNVIHYDESWYTGSGTVLTGGTESELIGHTQDVTGAEVRTVALKLRDIWCLEDFDGADDDAKLENAFAYAPDGAFIALRPGEPYDFADEHTFPTDRALGFGGLGSLAMVSYTGSGIFLTIGGIGSTPSLDDPKGQIENLYICGAGNDEGTAIKISDRRNSILRNVICVDLLRAFSLVNDNYTTSHTLFDDCHVNNCRYGWSATPGTSGSIVNTHLINCSFNTGAAGTNSYGVYIPSGVSMTDWYLDLYCRLDAEDSVGFYSNGSIAAMNGRLQFYITATDYYAIQLGASASNVTVDVYCYSNTVSAAPEKNLKDDSGTTHSGGFRFAQLKASALVPAGIVHRYLGAQTTSGVEIFQLRSNTSNQPVLEVNDRLYVEDGSQDPSAGTLGGVYAIHAETIATQDETDIYQNTGVTLNYLNVENVTFLRCNFTVGAVAIHGFMYGTDADNPGTPRSGHRLLVRNVGDKTLTIHEDDGNIKSSKNNIVLSADDKQIAEFVYDGTGGNWVLIGVTGT